MRRAVRILWNAAAVLSLVLCVGAAGAGVTSLVRADKFEYVSRGGRLVLLVTKSGRLDILYHGSWPGEPGFTHIRSSRDTRGGTDGGRRVLGFGSGARPNGARFVNVPYWFLTLTFGVPPALAIRAVRRRRRDKQGLCPACGYDLRESPDRCPECGTRVKA